ncbi:MAG: prephenate dehydrogenase [Lachnospiraceae bacterium]|nr:prephenate dehydrogenase [Lachnospiraceae bacterium]
MARLKIGFIGLGLIGGSIARALKTNIPEVSITAYDVNVDTLKLAVREQVVDYAAISIDNNFSDCDYLFLCAPVQKNDVNLMTVKQFLSPACLITDVGSVKTQIHTVIREAGLESQFIGGHPMTGSERTGFANSKAVLLENAYYILTPTNSVSQAKLEQYRELVTRLGAIPLILDYEQHDYVTAAISHLPHVIAASLVNLVREHDSADGIMKMIAAGGFKDITRIASSSAIMWQQICLTNTENINILLSNYIHALQVIQEQLSARDADALYELFDSARIYRDSFVDASSGPIKRSYAFKLDIADRPGGLATVVGLLAERAINIKNIGITHNREDEYGVLHMEFYNEEALHSAKKILSEHDYSIQD